METRVERADVRWAKGSLRHWLILQRSRPPLGPINRTSVAHEEFGVALADRRIISKTIQEGPLLRVRLLVRKRGLHRADIGWNRLRPSRRVSSRFLWPRARGVTRRTPAHHACANVCGSESDERRGKSARCGNDPSRRTMGLWLSFHVAVLPGRSSVRFKQHRIPAPIHSRSDALNRDLVPPAVAVVEEVLKRLTDLQLQSVERCRCRTESAIPRSRIVERHWRYVLLRTYHRTATSWRLREVERVQVVIKPVERGEDFLMQLLKGMVAPQRDRPPDPPAPEHHPENDFGRRFRPCHCVVRVRLTRSASAAARKARVRRRLHAVLDRAINRGPICRGVQPHPSNASNCFPATHLH
jgi:hypothetical protein